MFGGVGYFKEGAMFGAIMNGIFRLKADETNVNDFISRGKDLHQVPGKKAKMPYYEVPTDILENKTLLKEWADKAYLVALNAKKKK